MELVNAYLTLHAKEITQSHNKAYITLPQSKSPPEGYIPTGPLIGDENNPMQRYQYNPYLAERIGDLRSSINNVPKQTDDSRTRIRFTLENLEEKKHKLEQKEENWKDFFIISAICLIVINLIVAVSNIRYPIGFVPLIPLLFSFWIWNQKRKELTSLKILISKHRM